jgi:thiol-disulfide isomerase/thioredoxin
VKKYLPVLGAVMVFSMFLASQVLFDLVDHSSARPSKKERRIHAHYESIFSKIELETFDKKKIRLSEVKAPIVILNFWASWCKPCLHEFPSIVEMKKRFPDEKVLVLGINSDEENQARQIRKILKKYKLNFPIVPDKSGKILEEFMVSSIPISIIYRNGKIFEVTEGAKDFNSGETIEALNEILKVPKG